MSLIPILIPYLGTQTIFLDSLSILIMIVFSSNPTEASQGKVMVPLQFMLDGRRQQVYGFGSNKMMARKAAAKLALRQLCKLC